MPQPANDRATRAFEQAEQRLFAACGVQVASRRVLLADPPLAARVLEARRAPGARPRARQRHERSDLGAADAVARKLSADRLHSPDSGSATPSTTAADHCARTRLPSSHRCWTRRLAFSGCRSSGPRSAECGRCAWRSTRRTGSSGAGFARSPRRGAARHAWRPVLHGAVDAGLRQLVSRIRSPSVEMTRRSLARGVIGPHAAERAPEGFFEVVHEGMRQPGFRTAKSATCDSPCGAPTPAGELPPRGPTAADRRARPDDLGRRGPLRRLGDRSTRLRTHTRGAHQVIPGRHAPFIDDPERCGALIGDPGRRGT